MLDIHIGPGQLGLGLIVPCLRQAEIDVCLVGRPDADDEERRQYLLDSTDPSVGLEVRGVAYACNACNVVALPEPVRNRVADAGEPLLITCALGAGNAHGCASLVGELIEQRPEGADTVVIICENDHISVYDELEQRYGNRAVFCWSVVDRVCTWLDGPRGRDRAGRRAVRAHPVGEWVIGHPDPASPLMQALQRAEEVKVVAPDAVGGYRRRKLWTVNGLHFVLALLARRTYIDASRKRTDLLPLVAQQPAFQRIAAGVIQGIETGLAQLHPDLSLDEDYGPDRVQVFCETPDLIERLLKSLVRSDLRDFIARYDARVCDAARAAHAAGADVTVFRAILAVLLELLRDRRSYYRQDSHVPDRRPDAETDAEVVSVFERALREWLPEPERRDRVADLTRLLEAQRDASS